MRQEREAPSEEEIRLLREKARFIRLETIRLIEIAKVGHYSSVFSCAEIFAALYYDVMRLRPGEPQWPDRDRFLATGPAQYRVRLLAHQVEQDVTLLGRREFLQSTPELGRGVGHRLSCVVRARNETTGIAHLRTPRLLLSIRTDVFTATHGRPGENTG